MSQITENIYHLRKNIPENVTLVAVSKTRSVEEIMEAYDTGQRHFGENKVQELLKKQPLLPGDIHWHFIGHLQRNKVKFITPFIYLIHSADSIELVEEIEKEAIKNNRIVDTLLQFHIASEETKFGLDRNEAIRLVDAVQTRNFTNIRFTGVMGMASLTENEGLIRKEFQILKENFRLLKSCYFQNQDCFSWISMGMSGDYSIAIEEGSNMIRVGTTLFGERNYP